MVAKIPVQSIESTAPSEDRLVKVAEAGKMLSLSRASIYRLLDQGALPFVRIGGAIRFRRLSLLKWMEDRETPCKAA